MMRSCVAVVVLGVAIAAGQVAPSPSHGCLIVKHKGTLGRRLMWTALVGLPIAPGAKYDYIDAVRYSPTSMSFKGRELEALQSAGVHVIVLDNKYTAEELDAARKTCEPK
jgi:hypothetical protein